MKLEYLFTAVYKDGSEYSQNTKDISINNPDKSCFYDLKLDEIRYFKLRNGIDSYILDLAAGTFIFNEARFKLTDAILREFKLIYFRKVTLDTVTDNAIVKYILGYSAKTDANQEVTHTIII
jgi:hypothetical protein